MLLPGLSGRSARACLAPEGRVPSGRKVKIHAVRMGGCGGGGLEGQGACPNPTEERALAEVRGRRVARTGGLSSNPPRA